MMSKNLPSNFSKNFFEKDAWEKSLYVCGIDEVGRGCLAGPLITCALILPFNANHKLLKDSKTLNEDERNCAYKWIIKNSFYSIASTNHKNIDQINIYQATLQTMKKAFIQLTHKIPFDQNLIKYLLIDAMPVSINSAYQHKELETYFFNYGESISKTIAAASIVAKVTRDELIKKVSNFFPAYDLKTHKGYGTTKHVHILNDLGPTIIHRNTFISKILKDKGDESNQTTLF